MDNLIIIDSSGSMMEEGKKSVNVNHLRKDTKTSATDLI